MPRWMKMSGFLLIFATCASASRGAPADEKSVRPGLRRLAAGHHSEALDTFTQIISAPPEHPEGRFLKASASRILPDDFQRAAHHRRRAWRKSASQGARALSPPAEGLLRENPEDAREGALLMAGRALRPRPGRFRGWAKTGGRGTARSEAHVISPG